MSTLLERGAELHAGTDVTDTCPLCGTETDWWLPVDGRDEIGLDCTECDFVLDPVDLDGEREPPTILCSMCGEPLDRLGGERRRSTGYRCEPCGRTVGQNDTA